MSCNRNKKSMSLDLKSSEGKDVLRSLLERAGVVIENVRPGGFTCSGSPDVDVHVFPNPNTICLPRTVLPIGMPGNALHPEALGLFRCAAQGLCR
jgi:hypothetical protein